MDFQIIPSDTKDGAYELRQISDPGRWAGAYRTHYATMEEAQTAADKFQAAEDPLTGAGSAEYMTKDSSVYGEGRIYADQPGATQYDNGNGKYGIQIWDN